MNEYGSNINTGEFMKDVDSVNKLSSATSKLFAGGDNENYLHDIKDVHHPFLIIFSNVP